jgi:anti-sigma B factor antagonist
MGSTLSDTKRISVAAGESTTAVRLLDNVLVAADIVRELGDELCRLAEQAGHRKIILDCSEVDYISSAALNKLIIFLKKVTASGGRLTLCGLTPTVSEVFAVTRLNQKFNIESDQRAAAESMRCEDEPPRCRKT